MKAFNIAGYKRVQELTRPLTLDDTLTVLYGPNSSGKTSILQGIQLLLYQVYDINVRDVEITKLHRYLNFNSSEIVLASKLNFLGEYIDIEFRVKFGEGVIREYAITRIQDLTYYLDYESREGELRIRGFRKKYTLIAPVLGETHHLLSSEVIGHSGILSKGLLEDLLKDISREDINVEELKSTIEKLESIRDKISEYTNFIERCKEEGLEQLVDLISQGLRKNLVRYVKPQSSWEELNKCIEFLVSNYGKKFTNRFIEDINYITEFEFDDIVFKNGKAMFVMRDKLIPIDNLSAGLLNVINILTHIYEAYLWHEETSKLLKDLPTPLILLDTPEFNIHVDWLFKLLEVITSFDNIQIIIETHSGLVLSYAISNDFMCYYLKPINGKVDLAELTRDNIRERLPEVFSKEIEIYQQVIS